VHEVIAQSGLHTFVVEGDDARSLVQKLRGQPGVQFVSFFGAALHVSGQNRAALASALAPYQHQQGLRVTEAQPSLEDVFIQLQERGTGDYA
jgi:ABC-2 type transport system ATP-binding protein